MSKFKVGDKVVGTEHFYGLFEKGAVYTIDDIDDEGNDIQLEEIKNEWWNADYFELYQEPVQKTFNPKPGDIIVTESEGNWVCCTVGELNKLKNISFYTSKPIVGYQCSDYDYIKHQDWDEYGDADGFSEFSIKEIIPAATNNSVANPQENSDLYFKVKTLELENQMLRKLLRRAGVEV